MIDRIPFIYVDFDNARAISAGAPQNYNVLLMGQPNKPVTGSPALKRLLNESEAAAEYGDGSMLHLMAKALFENSTSTRTYAIPVSQNALEPATWKITLSPNRGVKNIPASVAIMGQDIGFIIPENLANQSPLDVLCQRIKADQSLPVEAKLDREKDTGKGPITSLTLTAKAKGLPAKSLSILPSSDLINVTSTDGSGTMDLSEVKKTIYNKQFHLIVCPYYNDATVAAMAPDLEERFSIKRQIEGQMITAVSGTMDEIKTQCSSKHITALALGTGSPTPHYVWAAALCGVIAESAQIDPARPFNTLPLRGCIPPPDEQRLERAQRAAFLDAGYSTYNVGFGGEPSIERLITMYKNDRAPADESYLSLNTLLTLSFLRYSFVNYFAAKYPRHKLADDTAILKPGSAILTPNTAKCETIALFKSWEESGYVENFDQFKNDLFVERSTKDRGRLDFFMSPRLVSQLNIMGARISFLI